MSVEADRTGSGRGRKVRRCRILFIFGAGFDPSGNAEALADEFRNGIEGLDFSKCRSVVATAQPWAEGDRTDLESSVHKKAGAWCRKHKVVFDTQRLLIRDYQDDAGQQYAVAAYVPASKSNARADEQPGAAPEPTETPVEPPEPEISEPAITESESSQSEAIERSGAREGRVASGPFAWLANQPPKVRRLIQAGTAVAVMAILAAIAIPFLSNQSGEPDDPDLAGDGAGDGTSVEVVAGLPPVTFATGILRVYTPEEGFHVLIDGEPVRDADGNLATTPCAVTAQIGNPTVTVFREGWFDISRVAAVSDDSEIELIPQKDAIDAGGSDILNAPLMDVEVGVPVALDAVNSNRPEFDPYLTPDRLSIWFAGDRSDGRGIFVSTRLSPLHQFEEPQIVARDADVPGSPCVTDDALFVVYTIPEKARLMALTRENPLQEFQNKEPLRHSKSLAPSWTSAQMLGDGLRMYWVETAQGLTRTLASGRDNRDQGFGKTLKVSMPGVYPCLSRDGLRQYVFADGKVTRYRRTTVTSKFVEDAAIGEVELENYKPSPRHRQYFVSSDEQWMYYCDDPQTGGDLYMVRLSDGPQWGVVPRGKSIPPKAAVVVVDEPDPDEVMVEPKEPEPKPIDPRSLPLPYTSHRESFVSLMGIRNYDTAEGLLRNAQANPAMKPFAEQLKWDEEDLAAVRSFWKTLEDALMEVKRGDEFRLGTLKLQFIEYDEGTIVGLRGTTRVERNLYELAPTDMTGLFDAVADKDDAEAQHLFAVFLQYTADDGTAISRLREQRIERAGELSRTFAERLGRRKLVQAQAEFDRNNFGKGVGFLNEVLEMGRGTPIAAEASEMESQLYGFMKWNPRGPRQWQMEGDSFGATLERANGALLVSGNQYHNFEVSLEWMTVNANTAQGGVYFRYPGDGNLLDYAFKLQLANDYGIEADQYSTGSLLGESAPDTNRAKPAGEWNTLLLRVVDDEMLVRINGRKVLETQLVSETVPDRGYVCLDGSAGGITYRKVLVTDLPD